MWVARGKSSQLPTDAEIGNVVFEAGDTRSVNTPCDGCGDPAIPPIAKCCEELDRSYVTLARAEEIYDPQIIKRALDAGVVVRREGGG
jgi:hypothetical protein